MSNETSPGDSQRSGANACSNVFPIYLEVLDGHEDEDQRFWAKRIEVPALPPVGCTVYTAQPEEHNSGWLDVSSYYYDEEKQIYVAICVVRDTLDFAACGWTRADGAFDLYDEK